MINKFTREEAELFTFYRMPKELFINPKYKKLSDGAKILYGLLLDRNSLSRQNEWFDEEGHVYIYFSREEVMEMLGVAKEKVTKLFNELKIVDLIEEVRQGQGKPNIIYVGKFVTVSPCKSTEVRKSNVKTFENRTTESSRIELQEVRKSNPNKTQLNRSYKDKLKDTHTAPENSDEIEVKTPSKTEGVCVDNTYSKIKENIQNHQTEEVEGLQEEIKKVTGQQISVKKIRELLADSSIERIKYHLANWHIHKQHQKVEGAGWFFTVIEHDIAPEKKKTGGTGKENGNIPLKDNFEQRSYTREECEKYYADLTEDIPHIERKGYI